MTDEIILVGGGGHCRSCIDVIETEGRFRIAGIVDAREKIGSDVSGYKIIACDDDLPSLSRSYVNFLITVGQIKSPEKRELIRNRLQGLPACFPVIISPRAHVSKRARLGAGSIVMHNAVVNTDAVIGTHCILNTGCIIEHDVRIGDFTHVSTAAALNGGVILGKGCFIGSNATLKEGLRVADGVVLAAGAVAIGDCSESGTYAGIPAHKVKSG